MSQDNFDQLKKVLEGASSNSYITRGNWDTYINPGDYSKPMAPVDYHADIRRLASHMHQMARSIKLLMDTITVMQAKQTELLNMLEKKELLESFQTHACPRCFEEKKLSEFADDDYICRKCRVNETTAS